MNEFALKLQEKSLEETEQLSIDLEEGLTTTTYVPTPVPAVATLAAKRAAITVQKGKVSQAESKLAMEQNDLATLGTELGGLLDASATHSQTAVSGDRVKMEEMKIPLRRPGTVATEPPPAPSNVRGTYGDMNQEVDFAWDGQGRGVIFFGEIATTPTGPFAQCYVGPRSRCTVKERVSGTEYFFRSYAERNGMRSNPSELANHRAT